MNGGTRRQATNWTVLLRRKFSFNNPHPIVGLNLAPTGGKCVPQNACKNNHFTSSLISAVTICLLWGAATFIVGKRTAPWFVVNHLCLRVQQALSLPFPCFKVDAQGGFSIPDRAALWHVVNDLCIPAQRTLSLPLPCLKVDTERGFAEIRAPLDETQILIVPTTNIEGIESPVLLQDIPRLIENPGEFPCILRLNGFG
jgi:hypothetical protein